MFWYLFVVSGMSSQQWKLPHSVWENLPHYTVCILVPLAASEMPFRKWQKSKV